MCLGADRVGRGMNAVASLASCPGELELPDGRRIRYQIRTSVRARFMRLTVDIRQGVRVTVPARVDPCEVTAFVASRRGWVAEQLARLDDLRRAREAAALVRPATIRLPAVGESWQVAYLPAPRRGVTARAQRPGSLQVAGAVEDVGLCQAALRRWLRRRAEQAFAPWLEALARETGIGYSALSVRNQRRRWGSCSHQGRVSLNCTLLFLRPEQVRYVMLHELCHRLEMNHSSRFWAQVARFEPDTPALRAGLRDAWRQIPAWAQPG